MKNQYTDSINPFGIGTGFFLMLAFFVFGGNCAILLIRHYYEPVLDFTGVILLSAFIFLLAVPVIRNKIKSRFERDRVVISKYDGMGTVQNLRGAIFRMLLYEDGLEIRSFYNTYFIPFDKVKRTGIEDNGFLSKKFLFETGIKGLPDYISSEASAHSFWQFVETVRQEMEEGKPSPPHPA